MWNDKETDVDFLGYDKIADTILEIVKDNHLRPLTIGVYGDWGVGKSSILALLQKNVVNLPEAEKAKVHTIVFNGWLFQGYEDTKSALMETIITDLARLQPKSKKIKELAKSLLKRVNWLKMAKITANTLFMGVTGIPTGSIDIAKKVLNLDTSDGDESFQEDEDNVPTQINAFREEFKELIKTSKIEQLIILVDDLDRCLPKSVIEILEAIRLFLFVEGTVFVISADEKMIEYAVREHFPNLPLSYSEYTKNYLEKLIQIPIRIPSLNKLQTGNYIKFLLLQNHLGNNLEEVSKIYDLYESRKSSPYDGIELSYEISKEALNNDSEELRKTLAVGDQITPLLSVSLRGNPRNIKRFLNTLFLRLKIAKIYRLDQIIQLDILAKLMLLERFHNDLFNDIVSEISESADGKSKRVNEFLSKEEDDLADGDLEFFLWNRTEPNIVEIDLRPYIFISKEKAISFDEENALSSSLNAILNQLESGSLGMLNQMEKELGKLSLQDASVLFDKLIRSCNGLPDLNTQPKQMRGVLRITKIFSQLEVKLMNFLASKPANSIGVWAVAENSNLQNSDAKKKFNELLKDWSVNGSPALRALSNQTINH